MTTSAIFHAFLRPAILQILRATGFHSTKPAVLDSLTDLAARYMLALCESTAKHATDNEGDAADFTAVDVRLALQDVGVLLPSSGKLDDDGEWRGDDDTRGIDEFVAWFSSQRMKELLEFGNSEGDTEATDYLNGLKTKHNKTGDEVKYQGTILGRSAEGSEVQVEGGDVTSIEEWMLLHAKTAISREPGSSPEDAEGEDVDVDADGELEAPTQLDTEMAMT